MSADLRRQSISKALQIVSRLADPTLDLARVPANRENS
jgi:hypothetical protein